MRHGHTIGESHDTDDEEDEFQFCLRNRYTPRCLVGVHKLSDGEADPQVGRWNRLLDAPKTHAPAVQQPMDNGAAVPAEKDRHPHGVLVGRPWNTDEGDNASGTGTGRGAGNVKTGPVPVYDAPWRGGMPAIGDGRGSRIGALQGGWEVISVWVVLGLVGAWVVLGRVRAWLGTSARRRGREQTQSASEDAAEQRKVAGPEDKEKASVHFANGDVARGQLGDRATVDDRGSPSVVVEGVATAAAAEVLELIRPSTPKVRPAALNLIATEGTGKVEVLQSASLVTPKAIANGSAGSNGTAEIEDGDESDGEVDTGAAATPGKRKNRRGKRGKKKKGVTIANGDSTDKDKETEAEVEKEKEQEKPSSIVLTTSSPKPIVQPSLIVSDTVLGMLFVIQTLQRSL